MLVLRDRAARCSVHKKKWSTSGSARANAPALRRTATCRAAQRWRIGRCSTAIVHSDVPWGSTSTTFNIFLLLQLLTSATEGGELFMRVGVCVSFWLPIYGSVLQTLALLRRLLQGWPLILLLSHLVTLFRLGQHHSPSSSGASSLVASPFRFTFP